MASISITIENDGSPVEGAGVYVGEVVGSVLTTDADGKVTKTVPDDFAIATIIIVRSGGARRGTFGPILLEAGGDYVLDIDGTAP